MSRQPIRCPACRLGGFKRCAWQVDRPRFICTRCDHEWTQGRSGGVYSAWLSLELLRAGARRVGPQHSDWDLIHDAMAVLEQKNPDDDHPALEAVRQAAQELMAEAVTPAERVQPKR